MMITKFNLRIIPVILFFFGSGISIAQETLPFQKEVVSIVQKYQQEPWEKGGILFTGSSSIRMWRDLYKYFPNTHIINTGFGGSKTNELVLHLEDLVLDFEPRKVFIYEGDNDVNAGNSTPEIISDFMELTDKIFQQLPESQLYLISAKPSPSRWSLKTQYLEFNQALKAFAQTDHRLTFIDVWTPMLDEKGNPRADLFVQDNLHLNEKGYVIWKSVFDPFVANGK